LIQTLQQLRGFDQPKAALEQVVTPAEAAVELLFEALARGDIQGRAVADLGSGTGVLAIGAALLGAKVTGIEIDKSAVAISRTNANLAGVKVDFAVGDVADYEVRTDTIVMNPPFGAQRRDADLPFWTTSYRSSAQAIYAFALDSARNFIERWAVDRGARIELTRPVRWGLPRTFPHHRKRLVEIPVDLWVLRRESDR
jgi:putative methylase